MTAAGVDIRLSVDAESFERGIDLAMAYLQMASEPADGPRWVEAIRGARLMRERAKWRVQAKAEGFAVGDRDLKWVALYTNGERRKVLPHERAGIPEGWFGRP